MADSNTQPITGSSMTATGSFAPTTPGNPITVDTLGQGASTPITLPPPTPYTPPINNVSAPAGTTVGDNGQATPTPANSSATSQVQDLITKLGTEGDTQNNLETNAGTAQLLAQKTADFNAYIQAKLDQTNTIAQMRDSNPDGQDKFGVDANVAKYQLESDAHISNLAVQSQISSGNYTDAENTITQKLDAMFTPIKDQISALSTLSTMENNDMTDSEKLQAQTKADQLKTDSANVQSATSDIQKTLLKNGNYSAVAPKIDSIISDYTNGKITSDEAQSQMYTAASPYGVADVTGGDIGANLPQVTMTAGNTPDPQAQAQFLSSLPTSVATLVKGLADYTVNPSTFATRLLKDSPGMTRADAIALAQQYDPSYSEAQYSARQALQTNFASGSYSQNINSLNTAVGHLADIPANFSKLGNAGFTPYNAVKNALGSTFGSDAITSAGTNINAAVGELASTFKGGGATDQEIKNLGSIGTNSSPSQAKGFVQTSINLLASRLNALTDTYTSGMGKAPTTAFLSPTNMTALSNLKNQGYDVNIKGVYFTDPVAYTKADPANATALQNVRTQFPNLTPAQATQYAQYLQENGQ